MYLVLGMNYAFEKVSIKVLSYSKSGDMSLIPLGLRTFALMVKIYN